MTEGTTQSSAGSAQACLLECVTPEQADEGLKALYDGARQMMGFVPNAAQLLAINPTLLKQHWDHVGHFFGHPTLNGALLAYIRYLVAGRVDCNYCIDMNIGFLVQAGVPLESIWEAGPDPDKMPLSDADKAMARFALKVVDDRHSISAADIATLKQHGWSERDIFDAAYHTAHAAALDMVLDAFKVENDIPPVKP